MIANCFHSATGRLLRLQSRGRARRMWNRFCQPRRLVLSAVASALALIWLGNAALTIWLRETASPETLRAMLSLGLAAYTGWHFAKAAFFRPESPFDWTPAERELLAAMPLGSRDLVAYQLASITLTTMLKAGLFTLLLLPDLRSATLGFVGMLLAMLVLEMLRLAIDIATWGMRRATFLVYRALVVVAGACVICELIARQATFVGQFNVSEGLLQRLADIPLRLNDSALGHLVAPFRPLIDLTLADRFTFASAGQTLALGAFVLMLAAAVIGLYAMTTRRMAERERRSYLAGSAVRDGFAAIDPKGFGPAREAKFPLRLRRLPRWGGAAAMAWRQLVGARRHWGSLLTAMIAPAVLAFAPGFVTNDPYVAFLATISTLAFYTFLLLPTALRFDFRRDLDRLATLKGLPITPAAAVFGQIFAPVVIASLFQTGVLAIAVAMRSLPPHLLVMAMLVLIPMNAFVFGLDNLIYLLYPYRVQQEGLEIFLRTMLTFTGKGLLFAIGLAATAGWGFAAAALSRGIADWTGGAINAYAVFTAGMMAGISILAALLFFGLCRAYRDLNPIEDMPR